MTATIDLLEELNTSIDTNCFVRLTLSKNRDKNADLKKIIIKLAVIKKTLHLSFIYRHQTKDITKNYRVKEGIEQIETLIKEQFLIANLFTTLNDISLEITNKKEKLRRTSASFKQIPERAHDKKKNHLIVGANYLRELGILNKNGHIQKDMGDKYKQINKFVEIIEGLIRQHPDLHKTNTMNVIDMGAGKGYLTFALYDYLVNTLKKQAFVKGIEVRPDLIKKCNGIAKKVGFDHLTFEEGYISDYDLPNTDILIALHACDTATDDAIYKGIQAQAELIICAPCCHKQIRKEIRKGDSLQPILDYGILKERQAEMITDTIRALLLEINGYKTKVFEFISSDHTGKNVMIVGQKHRGNVNRKMWENKITQLKNTFGIETHYLEELLSKID